MKFLSTFLLAAVLCFGCAQRQADLNRALELAGANRAELEAVLDHYSAQACDTQKYRAAVFLIANMPGHGGWDRETSDKYFAYVYPILKSGKPRSEKGPRIKEFALKLRSAARWTEDVETVTADYLIRNIDAAFDVWKNGRWAAHVGFEAFCEYLLPYRVAEYQPLDHWRDTLKPLWEKAGRVRMERVRYIDYRNVLKAEQLHVNMKTQLQPHLANPGAILPYHAGLIDKMVMGRCEDYAVLTTAALRSKGLPVAMDFTPQWTNRAMGHTWNVLLMNDGRFKAFAGATDDDILILHKLEDKWAKVYRHTYARNEELEELQAADPNFPGHFFAPFSRDVTAEYMQTSDVTVALAAEVRDANRVGYLGIFDNEDWVPSAYGRRRGRRIRFEAVGENNLFLPLFLDEYGESRQVNYPFILRYGGRVDYLVPDTTRRFSYTFDRKFPVYTAPFTYANKWIGGRIEAANKADFSDAVTVHRIAAWTDALSVDVSALPPYRYWRYVSSKGGEVNVSEMLFVSRNDPRKTVTGRIIGTDDAPLTANRTCRKMFDGDLLTHYLASRPSKGWAGMDFGAPVELGRIICYPRTDGNVIEYGDTYALYYMTDDGWECLGERKADDVTVTFDDIPAGALYLLDDVSKGQQKRPFTIERGKLVWW